MSQRIGLLVMHGIGDQAPGSVGEPMAVSLADGDVVKETDLCWSMSVENKSVLVAEANWSHISSPDNLPIVRLNFRFFEEMLKGATSAYWTFYGFGRSLPPRTAASAVVFVHILVAVWWYAGRVFGDSVNPDVVLGVVVSVGFLPCFFISINYIQDINTDKWWRIPLRVIRALPLTVVLMIFVSCAMIYVPLWILLSPLVFLPALVAWPIVWLVRTMSRREMFGSAKIWAHRLTWSTLIAPVQAFCQCVKGIGNMLAIVFVGPGPLLPRFGTYFLAAMLIPLLFLAMLVWMAAVSLPFGISLQAIEQASVLGAVVILFILIAVLIFLLKTTLAALDLALDVSSYHLASVDERHSYFKYARDGVSLLRSHGCAEIHILAHSLGTVIVYDWLRASTEEDIADIASLTTLGSPLYKFWYIDHSIEERIQDATGFEGVGIIWRNFYSWSDPVSNRLRKYGAGVSEHRLRWLGIWGIAHVKYWQNSKVMDYLKTALAGVPIADIAQPCSQKSKSKPC